jgi:hypothetical protein
MSGNPETPEAVIAAMVTEFNRRAGVCFDYEIAHLAEGNTASAEFHRGASMAFREMAEKLLEQVAQLRAQPPQDWRPIETAPRDGTWFLGWNEDAGHLIWRDGPGLLTGEDPAPTHWQPLPDPPADPRP